MARKKVVDRVIEVVVACLCIAALVVIVCSQAGCAEPTTKGFDGQPVTEGELEAQADERLDATEQWAEKELAGHEDAIAKVKAEVDATRRNIESRVNAGRADIGRQWQQREDVIGVVSGSAGLADLLLPGLGSILTGAVGVALGRAGRQKAADKAWDEAQAAKEAEIAKRDHTWDEAKRDAKISDPLSQLIPLLIPLIVAKVGTPGKGGAE